MPVVRRRTEHAVRLVVPKQRLHISIVEANAAAAAAASGSGAGPNAGESMGEANEGSPSAPAAPQLEPSGLRGLPLSAKLRNRELLLGLRSLGMTQQGAKKLIRACHRNETALGALEAERIKAAGVDGAAGTGTTATGPGQAAPGGAATSAASGSGGVAQTSAGGSTSSGAAGSAGAPSSASPKGLKVYSKLDNCADSAEWNSLLVWARGQRGPQWDEATGIWQVDRNSDVYFSTCDNPARGTAFDTTPDVPEDQVPGLVQQGTANAPPGGPPGAAPPVAGMPAGGHAPGAQQGAPKPDEDEDMSAPSVLNRSGRPTRSTGHVIRDSP